MNPVYISNFCFRINTKSKVKTKLGEQLEELEQGEGLATLMPDIQNTASIVSKVTVGMTDVDSLLHSPNCVDKEMVVSLEDQYLRIMKNLQFCKYNTYIPESIGKYVFSSFL